MKHTYIPCDRCLNWKIERRLDQPCPKCKNTQQIVNPQEKLCNLCGGSLCEDGHDHYGLYNAKVEGGYNSNYLWDLRRYTFSLCEKCLRDIFNQCKIKPDIDEMDMFGTATSYDKYAEDLTAHEYRMWKNNGGHHQAYVDGKCNAVKDCPGQAAYTFQYYDGSFTEECGCEDHKDRNPYRNISGKNNNVVKFISNQLKVFL